MTVTVPINPTPAPSRLDTPNFSARADAYHAWLPSAITAMNSQNTENNSLNTATNAAAAQAAADRVLTQAAAAAVNAVNPAVNAAAAAASAAAAAISASQAQATNPDTPIRLNSIYVTANFVVPVGYQAGSVGPIIISDGIVVTISTNSHWSIH